MTDRSQPGAAPIDPLAFRELQELIRFRAGICIDDGKKYLIETRLGPLLDELNVSSYRELCRLATTQPHALGRLIDEISTNETSWFRDKSPFDLLQYHLIPEVLDRLQGRLDSLRIWSAASSTGQEAYSIAIVLSETLPAHLLQRVRITGTDISDAAIGRARLGQYTDFELQRGLPASFREKYFQREGDGWRVCDELRRRVVFKTFNLLEPFRSLGALDIVFCRNVAIYFDLSTRQQLFERIARQLRAGGSLVIGASETLHGVTDRFERREHRRSSYYVVRP